MRADILVALQQSIRDWQAAADGEGNKSTYCALCDLCPCSEGDECPIFASGHEGCKDTPWAEWACTPSTDITESKRLAQAEADFLRTLLPTEQTLKSTHEEMPLLLEEV